MAAVQHLSLGPVDLAYEDHGAGGAPLVLVHGYTGGRVDWLGVVDALAERRRVVIFDNRGHGDSSKSGPYTFAALEADLAGLVDALDLAPFDLLGHSMGGIVAMRYALARPLAIRSLVVMDAGAEPAGRMPLAAVDGLAETGRRDGMGALAAAVITTFGATGSIAEAMRAKLTAMDVEAFAAFAHALDDYPSMLEGLGALRCPVTMIVGERDTGLRSAAVDIVDATPGAVLEVIADAGHSPQEDAPAAWLAAVERHLARAATFEQA